MKLLNEANLIYYSTCDSHTTKEGWLSKRGEVNRSFQKRWFVLKGNLLFYFEKPGDRVPSGVIILEGYTVELAETAGAETYTFQIVFHGGVNARKYILQAESHPVMDDWMKCITHASYEYMKVIVNELKAQLDELNAQELSMELRECKTREPSSLDPFGQDPFELVVVGIGNDAGSTAQSARVNPFGTKPAPGTGKDLFERSGDHLDPFGQVPFTSVQDSALPEQPKVPGRKKYKLSPRIQKKIYGKSDKNTDAKTGSSQFYQVTQQAMKEIPSRKPKVKSHSRFLELHEAYGIQIQALIHSKNASLLILDDI